MKTLIATLVFVLVCGIAFACEKCKENDCSRQQQYREERMRETDIKGFQRSGNMRRGEAERFHKTLENIYGSEAMKIPARDGD